MLAGLSNAPAALILSAQHGKQLQELQQIQGDGSGGLKVDVVTADATKPEDVSGNQRLWCILAHVALFGKFSLTKFGDAYFWQAICRCCQYAGTNIDQV